MGRKKRARLRRKNVDAGSGTEARGGRARRVALFLTAGVVALGIVTATLIAVGTARSPVPEPARARAAAGSADELTNAAEALRFRPSSGAGAGRIQNLPADAQLPPPSPGLLPVGSQSPDFALSTPTGERVQLSDYRGKTVLLEFFATWCPHCQAEAKHLVELHRKLPSTKFAFLSINVDSEDAATVLAYERFYGFPFPALLDPGGLQRGSGREEGPGRVSRQYKVVIYPTFYVIDATGRITWRSDREQPDALLMRELTRASGP